MPKRIGIFLDVSNLYYCIHAKYNKKLDYGKYIDYCRALGKIEIANAYGAQFKNQAANFLRCLKKFGYKPIYQTPRVFKNHKGLQHKADYDLKITIGIVEAIKKIDLLILGTADGDFAPVIEWVNKKGVQVIVFACNISDELKNQKCEWLEIPESFMEGEKNETS